MEDREEDVGTDQDETIQVEGTTSSSTPRRKAARSGSPIPPKILYKSTTGKGVAFTPEDVQYLLDYMEYRQCVLYTYIELQAYSPHFSKIEIRRTTGYGRILE